VADWTVILTAVGAAGVSGAFGYLGIRRSTDVTKKQITEETARMREQIEAENEKLRAQHREDHLRNRQGTYHLLLNADAELASALGQGIGQAQTAFSKFSDLGNGAVLFGTESVKDAVTAVLAQYVYAFREAQDIAGDKPVSRADLRAGFAEHAERIRSSGCAETSSPRAFSPATALPDRRTMIAASRPPSVIATRNSWKSPPS
jgi:hypothetical protein